LEGLGQPAHGLVGEDYMKTVLEGLITLGALFVCCAPARGQDQSLNAQKVTTLIDSIQGPALFKAYCAVCHGENGKGDGSMAPALKVKPADLTRIAARNGGPFPADRVQRIIFGEELLSKGHGTREMPVWGSIFSQVARDQDVGRVRVDNLARYLKDIQTK
jgi:mono/diheme cytochrome c family protein